jgi:uncharacterized protein
MSGATPAPDPRPQVESVSGEWMLRGWRCATCGHALALPAPWCPVCRGVLEPTRFGPSGTVWSATVVRVPLPGRTPPYALAYVDLDDAGPRVIAHLAATAGRRHVGDRVRLTAPLDGDVAVVLEGDAR